MALIPQNELTELKNAASVLAIAKTAVATQEEMSIAHLINSAANTGCTFVVSTKPISKELVEKLPDDFFKSKLQQENIIADIIYNAKKLKECIKHLEFIGDQ